MTTAAMTPGERVRAALKGEAVDRVPFCFWHHFKPEGSGERMASYRVVFAPRNDLIVESRQAIRPPRLSYSGV